MITRLILVLPFIFLVCHLTGCRTSHLDSAFFDIQEDIGQRLELPSDGRSQISHGTSAENNVSKLLEKGYLTPENAVIIGLLNNPDLKATFQDLGIVHADLIDARSLRNPKIEIMARKSDEDDSSTNFEFTIVQDVISLLFQRSRVKLSEIEIDRTKLKLTEKALNLAATIKKRILTYQAEMVKTEILEKIYHATKAASELALRQHEAGNISDLELAFQQMAHQHIKLGISRQEMTTQSARNQLNRQLGLWGEQTTWRLNEKLSESPGKTDSFEGLESTAMAESLGLAALRLENQSLHQKLSLARKGRITDLELGFNTEKEPEGERLTGGLIEFGVPIFDRNQGSIAKLNAMLHKNDFQVKAIAIEIRSQFSTLRYQLESLRGQLEYYNKSVMPLREKVVNLSQRHYNAMFIGTYELLQAKQNELSAQMDYVNLLRDYWVTHTDFRHLLAGGIIQKKESGHEPLTHSTNDNGKDDH